MSEKEMLYTKVGLSYGQTGNDMCLSCSTTRVQGLQKSLEAAIHLQFVGSLFLDGQGALN